MTRPRTRGRRLVLVCALFLAGCAIPRADYDQLEARYEQALAANRQLQADKTALEAQLAQQAAQNTYTVAADLLFAPGGFDITQAGQAALNDILTKLREVKNGNIVVYGYTDDQRIGSGLRKQGIATNLELSSKRADTVADYLRARGVNPGMVSAKGRGETQPVAPNTTAEGRARNRRIEIVVAGPGG